MRQRTTLRTLVDDSTEMSIAERRRLVRLVFEEISADEVGLIALQPREDWSRTRARWSHLRGEQSGRRDFSALRGDRRWRSTPRGTWFRLDAPRKVESRTAPTRLAA